MRKPLIAGNWKMNLNHLEAIITTQKLAFGLNDKDFDRVEVAVLPPFTDLRSVQTLIDGDKLRIEYGGQDLSQHDGGAYTGDVSGAMLAKLGCTFVLAGHSERRQYHHEDDDLVNAKVQAAYRNSLTPILCVGEGLAIRQAGGQVAYTVSQLDGALHKVTAEQAASIVLAYEPVWAIGTGEVATPADAQEVCGALRARLAELYDGEVAAAVRILYGGSVKSDNIAGIMAQTDVDGVLVGGASLDPGEFVKICRFGEISA
ncbi:triose-phosphate isomerase [Streptosporangium lutulentum]|uniref:Triosephosphate isomerase n=1 Tax=Streptosporangium lutulentum TaxID=1461250 RepID=A0ABT9QF58_9ACTN|nr:triose-phosphate isomerase [Streptosporangium lutulentum]MDP9844699.1 triosephosphate isomerase [Streptosporangium lutulentum]